MLHAFLTPKEPVWREFRNLGVMFFPESVFPLPTFWLFSKYRETIRNWGENTQVKNLLSGVADIVI